MSSSWPIGAPRGLSPLAPQDRSGASSGRGDSRGGVASGVSRERDVRRAVAAVAVGVLVEVLLVVVLGVVVRPVRGGPDLGGDLAVALLHDHRLVRRGELARGLLLLG